MNQGYCTNLPSRCSKAAKRELLARQTPDTRCPECGSPLIAAAGSGGSRRGLVLAGIGVLVAAVLGVFAWWLLGRGSASGGATATVAPPPATKATAGAAQGAPGLRLHGSNTIGAALAPALLEAFAKKEGYATVTRKPGANKEEMQLVAQAPGKPDLVVEVAAHGTGTGFKGLRDGTADVAMASRAIRQDELESLKSLGDFTSSSSEAVIALDGLAVIVNAANPLQQMTLTQLRDVFTGAVTDWKQVGGVAGAIKRYARDDQSGTFDTFKSLVLGNQALATGTTRFEDSKELSDAVANDAAGIGFIGLPYVRNARALAIADGSGAALRPTRFTVASEDYALSRRLYLYVAPQGPPLARRFVEFAASNDGQRIADQNGFVGQVPETVTDRSALNTKGAPAEFLRLTRNAEKLSNTFRFRFGSSELDTKAERDVARLVGLLEGRGDKTRTLMLLGFADNIGAADANVTLSIKRAETVAQALTPYGVKPAIVHGFGAALPVADNGNENGRERNRRVEVWVSDQIISPPAGMARR